jgi:hypothetical protein
MKKIVLPALLALASLAAPLASQAQCPTTTANVITVGAQTITTNTTWTRNNIYLLNGFVYVDNNATLTIEPGTLIKGDLTNKGTLIIRQGAKINAAGTPTQPIVFTSNQPAGSRAPGDWGGIILLGRAPQNVPGSPTIEGGVVGTYGGTDPLDNSGVMQYVRIEFPGVSFIQDSEINGLTLGAVGAGTTIDHIQVTASGDDSFEWFGGTVNAKYLIAMAGTDDDFDTDNGFSGRVQFGVSVRDPQRGDYPNSGVSNGFESDNDATGTANTPQTSAVFSNMTVIMPSQTTYVAPFANAAGALIRRNSAESIFNSVFANRRFGVVMNSNSSNLTTANAASNSLQLQNNVFAGYAPLPGRVARVTSSAGTTAGFNINTFIGSSNDTTRTVAGLGLNADNFQFNGACGNNRQCAPAFELPAASALNTGAAFTSGKLAGAGIGVNGTFDVVAYRGAFGATNWATGWTNFNPQITCYNTAGQVLANREVVNAPLQALAVSPNPTEGAAATLGFDVKTATTATVRVVDMMGREVAVVLNGGKLSAGPQRLLLPASLAPGMYVATVATGDAVQSTRFVVSK